MTKKKNDNCLEGMQCPKCKSLEPFVVVAKCFALVHDDGISDSWNYEWGHNAFCECTECNHAGTVKDFIIKQRSKSRA